MRKFTRKLTHFGDTKMAKSSIKFARTQDNSVAETTREFEAHYLLEKKYRLKNEYWNCGKTDSQVFKEELAKTKRKGGPKPKEENSLWEAILNLNAEHTMADVQRAVKLVEKKFNITCTRVAIHRDEGHINKEGKVVYNLHAHLNFVTFKNGRQNWRQKFIRPMMSDLQTEIAKELKMERGRFKDETGVVAMGHREYRAHAKTVEKIQELVTEKEKELVTEKEKSAYNFREMQQRITALETLTNEQKKELHKLNSETKNTPELEIKNSKIQELEEKIAALSKQLENREKALLEILPTATKPAEVVQYVHELEKDLSEALQDKTGLEMLNRTLIYEKSDFRATESVLNKQIVELKTENEVLQAENEKLTWYKKQYQAIVSSLKTWTKLDDIKAVMQNLKQRFEAPKAKIESVQEFEEALPLRSIHTATGKIREGLEASNEPPLLKIEKLQVLDEFERQRLEAALPNAKITLDEHLEAPKQEQMQEKEQMQAEKNALSNNIEEFNNYYGIEKKRGISR